MVPSGTGFWGGSCATLASRPRRWRSWADAPRGCPPLCTRAFSHRIHPPCRRRAALRPWCSTLRGWMLPARIHMERARPTEGSSVDFALPVLEAGAYEARLRVGGGTTTRHDFACEAGGDEWADSRPDARRLRALADATGGVFAWADEGVSRIPFPK